MTRIVGAQTARECLDLNRKALLTTSRHEAQRLETAWTPWRGSWLIIRTSLVDEFTQTNWVLWHVIRLLDGAVNVSDIALQRADLSAQNLGLVVLDAKSHVMYANERALELFETNLDGLRRHWLEKEGWGCVDADGAPLQVNGTPLQSVLRSESSDGDLIGIPKRDGTIKWVIAYVERSHEGPTIGTSAVWLLTLADASSFAGTSLDDRVLMDRLGDRLQIQREVLDTVHDGILVLSDTLRIMSSNLAAQELCGVDAPSMYGRHMHDFVPSYQPGSEHAWALSLFNPSDKRIIERQHVLRTLGGEDVPVGVSTKHTKRRHQKVYLLVIRDLRRQRAFEEQVRRLALNDPLTSLPNRRLLLERMRFTMASTAKAGTYGALVVFDLDDFKEVNDSHGHMEGDGVLLAMAHRLGAGISPHDTLARIGSDEFGLVIHDAGMDAIGAAAHIKDLIQELRIKLGAPFVSVNVGQVHLTASVGVVLFNGFEETAADLLKKADIALHQAKAAGRDSLRFYDKDVEHAMLTRIYRARNLRDAIARGEFHLVYQPQIDRNKNIMGVEALARWTTQLGESVSPAEFIPLAEELGVIVDLGRWVLEEACRLLVRWSQDPMTRHWVMAVNVSAKQISDGRFVDQVLDVLRTSGAEPALLKLELTESSLANDVAGIAEKINQLRQYGVTFSLDDFGTGYSSLAYVQRLPFSQLKVDQSFVRELENDAGSAAVTRAILNLGESLGLSVIAEGVEREAQFLYLMQYGCQAFQGYLIAPPLPPDALYDFAANLRHGSESIRE